MPKPKSPGEQRPQANEDPQAQAPKDISPQDPYWVLKRQHEEEKGPRHVGTGLASGALSFVGGVVGGVAGVFVAPGIGAAQGGARGFVKGVGIGLGGLIILPVVGAASAVMVCILHCI